MYWFQSPRAESSRVALSVCTGMSHFKTTINSHEAMNMDNETTEEKNDNNTRIEQHSLYDFFSLDLLFLIYLKLWFQLDRRKYSHIPAYKVQLNLINFQFHLSTNFIDIRFLKTLTHSYLWWFCYRNMNEKDFREWMINRLSTI